MPNARDEKGKFKKSRGWYIDEKGYPKFSAGPHRGRRVHIVIMERMCGHPLEKGEIVHHKDMNKRNFRRNNLEVMSTNEHNAVSAKQYWFLKNLEKKEKARWDEWLSQKYAR